MIATVNDIVVFCVDFCVDGSFALHLPQICRRRINTAKNFPPNLSIYNRADIVRAHCSSAILSRLLFLECVILHPCICPDICR